MVQHSRVLCSVSGVHEGYLGYLTLLSPKKKVCLMGLLVLSEKFLEEDVL